MTAVPGQIDKPTKAGKATAPGLLARMCAAPVVANAAQVALVVGTCLNAINQGSAIWHGAAPDWGRLVLNYLVPFLVASFSAARTGR